MTTTELSDLFFNSRQVEDAYDEGPVDEVRLRKAAEEFLDMYPSLRDDIDEEWLVNDYKARV